MEVVVPTPADDRRAARSVRVVRAAGKGRGLVARRDLPAWTLVGPYPGVRRTRAAYRARVDSGATSGRYAVDYWRRDASGAVRTAYVVDPEGSGGALAREFARAVAPLANEPSAGAAPTLAWVWNLVAGRVELWTRRAVRAGEELSVCYGPHYGRDYRTACTTPGAEPWLHVITRAHRRPVPFSPDVSTRA